ncbi:MAG TPA: hypothetical protein PKD51_05710 [Saprospiraceae bacterium]|nr:hypothetical protein [Saprospiraceae bacterium]
MQNKFLISLIILLVVVFPFSLIYYFISSVKNTANTLLQSPSSAQWSNAA